MVKKLRITSAALRRLQRSSVAAPRPRRATTFLVIEATDGGSFALSSTICTAGIAAFT